MDISAAPRVVILLVVLYLVWKVALIFYNAFTSPLKQLPGPFHARLTNLRLKLAVITGRRMYYVDSQHKKYGPIVRLTPTEVAVADPHAFQQIHKIGSGFHKTRWYFEFTDFDIPQLFTMSDAKQHAARRKLLARGFSKSYLRTTWEVLVKSKVELTVRKMKDEGLRGQAVDVLKWWTLLATDVSTHLMFGKSFEMIEKGEADTYIRTLQSTLKGNGIGSELPLVRLIGSWMPLEACRRIFASKPFLMAYGTEAIRGSKQRGDTANIFAKIISESEKERSGGLGEEDIVVEATGLIIAGSDTTGISLTYLVWAVLSRPQLKDDLQKELSALPQGYTDQDLEDLPLLNAVIDETLRLYGAAPGGLPRLSPPEGAQLGGYHIPGGITVTTQAYTLHRDSTIFEDALKFDPSRWFQLNSADLKPKQELAKAVNHPFGAGSRTCIGIHLARMELRLGAAEFFRQCKDAKLAPSTTATSMQMENFFLIAPQSHRCDVLVGS